ncbi:CAP domain-containing protein [Qipengyuania sp. XHP0207]|uniref:CAP domain-containing protein n=1 Tax=Qipengyuania sp. XHP0207 TaxID=3038078 RepID=UPI00241DB87A|nr:CAP domain-containing protein [Qipengyuania sp. XHP0207]MDG5749366.1 CAP domain-containing protein [Qipengyuania sp. XHP0207]
MSGSKNWKTPIIGAIGLLSATAIGVAASASSSSQLRTSDVRTASRILDAHNQERDRLRLPRLKWNVHLEREAHRWAHELSRKGRLQHADHTARDGTGENLWMGTAGHWSPDMAVGRFIEEKKHYRHGSFPHISRTGNWADVAHYTQIVWRDTQEVGCAWVTARGNDILVCRYWPAGNVWGRKAY